MAWHFARLKLALVRNGLLRNRSKLPFVILSALLPIPFVLSGALALMNAADARHPATVTTVTAVGLFILWIMVPVLGYGNDDTLDPSVFALLPLTTSQLMRGMVAAALVGTAPMFTAIMLIGAVIGFTTNFATLVAGILLAALQLLVCVTVSRAITASLGRLLASRRGRDLGIVISVALLVGLQAINLQVRQGSSDALDAADRWLRFTPPGLIGHGFAALETRQWGEVAAAVAINGLLVVAALMWWSRSLTAIAQRGAEATTSANSTTDHRASSLFGRMPVLPHNRTGAVAMRELRSFRRDPKRAAMLIPTIAIPVVWAFSLRPSGTSLGIGAPLLALAAVVFTNRFSANMFGIDGNALWVHVAEGSPPKPDIVGKQIAIGIIVTPIVITIATGLGAVAGSFRGTGLAIALLPCVLATHLGIGAQSSVRFPQALPERGSPFGTLNGQGCANGLAAIAMLALELVLLLPIAIALAVAIGNAPIAVPFVIIGSWAVGYAIWSFATNNASTFAATRLPELLTIIDPKQA